MAEVRFPSAADSRARLNVADRLAAIATRYPGQIAVACPRRWSPNYSSGAPPAPLRVPLAPPVLPSPRQNLYSTTTFAELDQDATQIARGLAAWGVVRGTRLALLVRPGIEFVTLVFALLRAGMTIILIDPGLGRRNMIRCLAEAEPEGFVAIPAAQAARLFFKRKFPRAKWNVTVGRRWFWGGKALDALRDLGRLCATGSASAENAGATGSASVSLPTTQPDDPAAIIFTSGSTGPPKGVLYTHRMFDMQVSEIQSMYAIKPGAVDLGCFPLFALFNSAMGVTTVLPEMDFSRPAAADAKKLLAAANDWQVTQAFASPAVWRVVSEYCAKTGERIPSLREIFSCGAPVPADVQRATLACVADGARMHTPYGATECLPVSTIEAQEILSETAAKTDQGAGVCVGRPFDSIEWRVIRITDNPIATIDAAEELPAGEIGELIVRAPQASPRYVTRTEANNIAKIQDNNPVNRVVPDPDSVSNRKSVADPAPDRGGGPPGSLRGPDSLLPAPRSPLPAPFWHRMGDVGYLDDEGRFWYCGRKSHRVETADGPLFTECVEGIVNTYPGVKRSALVGIGAPGKQTPVLVVESESVDLESDPEQVLIRLRREHDDIPPIDHLRTYNRLPVDVRHNAKINRELLAKWAAATLPNGRYATRSVAASRSHAEREERG